MPDNTKLNIAKYGNKRKQKKTEENKRKHKKTNEQTKENKTKQNKTE